MLHENESILRKSISDETKWGEESKINWESSRKIPRLSIIVKTLDRDRKFKDERDVVET